MECALGRYMAMNAERRLTALQQRCQRVALLVVDEVGCVPFERAGGELQFDLLASNPEVSRDAILTLLPRRRTPDPPVPEAC
jgi:DNA replication protein DnaC